jgi:hypothetical protein
MYSQGTGGRHGTARDKQGFCKGWPEARRSKQTDKTWAPLGEDLQIVHFVGTLSPRLVVRWGWWLWWDDREGP